MGFHWLRATGSTIPALALALLLLGFSTFAYAQDDPPASETEEREIPEFGETSTPPVVPEANEKQAKPSAPRIEEITVTAQKRAENIQDVPISVSALSEQFLEDSGLTEFQELENFVPNLRINPVTDSRSTSVRIRGIGSIGTNAGIDPSVGIFIDGVYQGRAGMSIADLLDIEIVQVLRGPQGTLYGKNTAAGAIVINTRRPIYDYETTLETVLGSFNQVEFRGAVNLPVVEDRIATRLSGFKVARDGFDTNRFNGEAVNDANKFGVRSKTLFDITENLALLLSGDYSMEDTKCCVADIKSYEGPPALFVTFEQLAMNAGDPFPPAPVDEFDRRVGANTAPKNKVQIWGAAAELEYVWNDFDVNFLNAYRGYTSDSQLDGDFEVYDAVIAFTDTQLHQFSSELRIASPGGEELEYQAGLYFYYSTQDTIDRNGFEEEWAEALSMFLPGQTATANIGNNTHETLSYAAFGNGTWRFREKWALNGGLRLTHEQKSRVGSQTSNNPALPPPVGGPNVFKDEQRTVTNISGRVSLQYYPTDDAMIFTSFANGFKSGGFNQLRTPNDVPSEFGDENSLTGEIGFRTSWFDRRVTFNMTGFYTAYDDFQTQTFDGTTINIRNATSLTSYGIESDFLWLPLDELTLGGSVGWNVATFDDFKTAEATAAQQDQQGGVPFGRTACSLTVVCTQDLSGRTLDNAPVWSISAYTQYERLFPWFPVYYYGRADYSFTAEHFLAQDLDENLLQDGYHLLNLRAGIRAEDDLWDLTFWIKNVTDADYNVVGFDVPILNGYAVINGPPRQFGATIRVKF